MTEFELVIDEDFEYVDRALATASWWDRYLLRAGRYPIEYLTVNYHVPWQAAPHMNGSAYWGVAKVKGILVETYRVNRLLTASSSETRHPNTETTKHFQWYEYQIKDQVPAIGEWTGVSPNLEWTVQARFVEVA